MQFRRDVRLDGLLIPCDFVLARRTMPTFSTAASPTAATARGYKLTGIGGFARAFLRRGAGAFIGTLWSVGDSPAREFTEEFYLRLKSGNMIAEAAGKARTEGDATWLVYVVYGHPHAKLS